MACEVIPKYTADSLKTAIKNYGRVPTKVRDLYHYAILVDKMEVGTALLPSPLKDFDRRKFIGEIAQTYGISAKGIEVVRKQVK